MQFSWEKAVKKHNPYDYVVDDISNCLIQSQALLRTWNALFTQPCVQTRRHLLKWPAKIVIHPDLPKAYSGLGRTLAGMTRWLASFNQNAVQRVLARVAAALRDREQRLKADSGREYNQWVQSALSRGAAGAHT